MCQRRRIMEIRQCLQYLHHIVSVTFKDLRARPLLIPIPELNVHVIAGNEIKFSGIFNLSELLEVIDF